MESDHNGDLGRESKRIWEWSPSRSLLMSIRLFQQNRMRRSPWGRLLTLKAKFDHRLWSIISGADIPINASIGAGLLMPHPNGIVIHPNVKIGSDCLIFQQVTIGMRVGAGVPVVGRGVDIGAGAKILGPITIGDGARVGANSVVTRDVPAGATVVGIPAKIIRRI